MTITFLCGYCGQSVVTEEEAGQAVDCPKCGKPLLVPFESEPSVKTAAPPQEPESLPGINPELDVNQSTQQISFDDHGKADADISFDCHSCGQRLVVDRAGANMILDCPKCGTALGVPNVHGR